jgi:dihydropyrimidinase
VRVEPTAPPFDLLVRGGTVVRAEGSAAADVGVRSGTIAAVEPGIPPQAADRVIEADGLLVLPGVIDVHTHMRLATDDEPDRFFQDSVAAAQGGTTTFLSFNNPGTGTSEDAQRTLRGGISEWLERSKGDSAIDFGLSAVITAQQADPLADLGAAIDAGVPTFKAFMVYDFGVDEALLGRLLAATGRLPALLQIHCEDARMLVAGIRGQLDAGRNAPRHHADSRPPEVEGSGTARAIALAAESGAPMYAVHLSCADALAHLAAARARGQAVYAETCPHFLALDSSRYDLPDEDAIGYLVSPPLRSRTDVDALWVALADGTLDLVATDHVPDRLAVEKRYTGQPFTEISSGAPGIETLLAIVYSEGVARGRISIERMVDLLATTPARRFGLASKGSIEVDRNADLVLFDPAARRTLRQSALHHTSDYTPYEGMALTGAVRHVLLRGADVIRDGAFVGRRGAGRFQERSIEAVAGSRAPRGEKGGLDAG